MEDLTGKKYNSWTVIKFGHRAKRKTGGGSYYWLCRCDCGIEKEVLKQSLIKGKSTKCKKCQDNSFLGKYKFNDQIAGSTERFHHYERSAKLQERSFSITLEEFNKLTSMSCYYCNTPPQKRTLKKRNRIITYYLSGLDRINSNLGYELNNIVTCCSMCNSMKSNFNIGDFINQCLKISANHKN